MVRQEKAYPVYDDNYRDIVEKVSNEIENDYNNFYLVGRNGMHKYNNQDHSMLTALRSAELVHEGNLNTSAKEKLWLINTEEEYLEQK